MYANMFLHGAYGYSATIRADGLSIVNVTNAITFAYLFVGRHPPENSGSTRGLQNTFTTLRNSLSGGPRSTIQPEPGQAQGRSFVEISTGDFKLIVASVPSTARPYVVKHGPQNHPFDVSMPVVVPCLERTSSHAQAVGYPHS